MAELFLKIESHPIILQTISIIMTLGLGLLAFWAPVIHNILRKPKLKLIVNNAPNGTLIDLPGKAHILFHHLKIVNRTFWRTTAYNAAVYCVGVEYEDSNSDWVFRSFPKVRLHWPYETKADPPLSPTRNISTEDLCDLCFLSSESKTLEYSFQVIPYSLSQYFKPSRPIRMHFKVFADNFESKRPLVIQFYWDSIWKNSELEMAKHLKLSKITKSWC